ncbi:malto-oligosyltrehalose synthase [Kineococcus indalonis]|uniref:malto-oligosyltrehalose synthase n=1 Tax=Kineococcus indalonis TaxID=2696566 RepID=UPI0014134877|nr:malto-oligosyltrehalose synthase [Kineococcus indalonis]NAZ85266.1 malto-oligosyltrehalose synthase [Kineococcus indalonis]
MTDPTYRPAVVPTSTYRFQVQPAFTFDDAAAQAEHLQRLGVSHAYLSPVLAPAEGSTHGYDVVDHSRLNEEAGGRAGFDRLVAALRGAGLAAVADVVPNHMAVPTPAHDNAQLWSVLKEGPRSPYARWFDVDWSVQDRAILMAVLGQRIGQVLAAGELSLGTRSTPEGEERVLRYYDHVFPVRPGTEDLPLAQLVDRQWYRLAHWRVADEELNYRRFFDVDTLAAIRVEDREVFDASHALLLELVGRGDLQGLRIDHPDGLADPRGYLRWLAEATSSATGDGSAWVVVEKILEGEEVLPADWACAGTTGYDALQRVGGLFLDPAGAEPLTEQYTALTGETGTFQAVVDNAKREVVEHGLYAEVHRLVDLLSGICHDDVDLRDHTRRGLHECVVELLVAFHQYRAYVVPGEPAPPEAVRVVEGAAEHARAHLPEERHDTLQVVVDLALGRAGDAADPRAAEFVVRFQQTCGPVMAKGIEDTSFYRWFRLSSLNEVGGDPTRFGTSPEEFHSFCSALARDWPAAMTTLSTHDTKRSEDVRARLSVLSELTEEWGAALARWRELAAEHRAGELDARTELLVWQTLFGTWGEGPIGAERLLGYLQKATREAKDHTTWTSPDEAYEHAVERFATGVLGDEAVLAAVREFVEETAAVARVAVLGQKFVQLAMPGVPDVYQGTELVDLSLVDPDNRRPVDYADRARRLAALDGGSAPADLHDEKLLVVSRTLRARREHPELFVGEDAGYSPVPTTTGHALAFGRGPVGAPGAIAVTTRLPVSLQRHGGWGEHTLSLPEGTWRDEFTGATVPGGAVRIADVLGDLPVALLVRRG